ncbi:hypothetical protein OXX59_003053 [Metschnikowia pulcherrima]
MVQEVKAESLLLAAEDAKQSLDSISKLLQIAEDAASKRKVDSDEFTKAQRHALLDSFKVKKFHREFKEWEHTQKEVFVETEVKRYNQKYAQMSRVYADYERSAAIFEDARKTTQIPQFSFSLETIKHFENGVLLERVEKGANGEYPGQIALSSLFSLDADSGLPPPSFQVFNKLVNLEYRLRMLLQIKHEVLLRAKTHLAAKNSQWASRDAKLNSFLGTDFRRVYEEIEKIKTSEYEDLKYYEEDFEEEEEDLDDDGENEESRAGSGDENGLVEAEDEHMAETRELEEEMAENMAPNADELDDQPADPDMEVENSGEALTAENSNHPNIDTSDEKEALESNGTVETAPEQDLSEPGNSATSTENHADEKEDMELD